tara:strand:+ start:3381 stop:3596 length:216 start_codon:yes stop_codon:yes gene_type:complete
MGKRPLEDGAGNVAIEHHGRYKYEGQTRRETGESRQRCDHVKMDGNGHEMHFNPCGTHENTGGRTERFFSN